MHIVTLSGIESITWIDVYIGGVRRRRTKIIIITDKLITNCMVCIMIP